MYMFLVSVDVGFCSWRLCASIDNTSTEAQQLLKQLEALKKEHDNLTLYTVEILAAMKISVAHAKSEKPRDPRVDHLLARA